MGYIFPEYPPDWPQTIKRIKKRDSYTCQKCGTRHPRHSKYLRVHHIISLSQGGSGEDDNLETQCTGCHCEEHPHLKGEKKPKEVGWPTYKTHLYRRNKYFNKWE